MNDKLQIMGLALFLFAIVVGGIWLLTILPWFYLMLAVLFLICCGVAAAYREAVREELREKEHQKWPRQ